MLVHSNDQGTNYFLFETRYLHYKTFYSQFLKVFHHVLQSIYLLFSRIYVLKINPRRHKREGQIDPPPSVFLDNLQIFRYLSMRLRIAVPYSLTDFLTFIWTFYPLWFSRKSCSKLMQISKIYKKKYDSRLNVNFFNFSYLKFQLFIEFCVYPYLGDMLV